MYKRQAGVQGDADRVPAEPVGDRMAQRGQRALAGRLQQPPDRLHGTGPRAVARARREAQRLEFPGRGQALPAAQPGRVDLLAPSLVAQDHGAPGAHRPQPGGAPGRGRDLPLAGGGVPVAFGDGDLQPYPGARPGVAVGPQQPPAEPSQHLLPRLLEGHPAGRLLDVHPQPLPLAVALADRPVEQLRSAFVVEQRLELDEHGARAAPYRTYPAAVLRQQHHRLGLHELREAGGLLAYRSGLFTRYVAHLVGGQLRHDPQVVHKGAQLRVRVAALVERAMAVPPGAQRPGPGPVPAVQHLADRGLHDQRIARCGQVGEQVQRLEPLLYAPQAATARHDRVLGVEPGGPDGTAEVLTGPVPAVVQAHQRVIRVGAEALGARDQVFRAQPAQRGDRHREPDMVLLMAALDDADHLAAVTVDQRPARGAGHDPDIAAELKSPGVAGTEADRDEGVDGCDRGDGSAREGGRAVHTVPVARPVHTTAAVRPVQAGPVVRAAPAGPAVRLRGAAALTRPVAAVSVAWRSCAACAACVACVARVTYDAFPGPARGRAPVRTTAPAAPPGRFHVLAPARMIVPAEDVRVLQERRRLIAEPGTGVLGLRVEQPDQGEVGAGGGGAGFRGGAAQVVSQPRGHHPAAAHDPEDTVRAGVTAPPIARREHMSAGQHPSRGDQYPAAP